MRSAASARGRAVCVGDAHGHTDDVSAIAVVRIQSSLGGSARRYKLLIDGEERGSLACGTEVIIPVEPGDHEIQARIDWTGSDVLRIAVEPERRRFRFVWVRRQRLDLACSRQCSAPAIFLN